jgi:hypothetical protein
VETKWVTKHAPFRKNVRAELRTLLLRDDRQSYVCKYRVFLKTYVFFIISANSVTASAS